MTVQPGKERSWEEFIHVYLMEGSIEDTGMVTQTGCAVPILEDTQNLILYDPRQLRAMSNLP